MYTSCDAVLKALEHYLFIYDFSGLQTAKYVTNVFLASGQDKLPLPVIWKTKCGYFVHLFMVALNKIKFPSHFIFSVAMILSFLAIRKWELTSYGKSTVAHVSYYTYPHLYLTAVLCSYRQPSQVYWWIPLSYHLGTVAAIPTPTTRQKASNI